jgi:hypothetical protein
VIVVAAAILAVATARLAARAAAGSHAAATRETVPASTGAEAAR